MQAARDLLTDSPETSQRTSLFSEVMDEICRQLASYDVETKPVTARTVIYRDLSIDSLAVMDIILELEDRFDVFIPINVVAEIRTVEELADAIVILRARR